MAEPPQHLARWQKLANAVSAIVAPITLVTALLAYTAWTRTKTFFNFFGVDSSILGLSIQDYLLRSADTTFGLLVWTCVGGVAGLAVILIASRLSGLLEESIRNRVRVVVAWLALGCVLVGLLSAVWPALSRFLTPYGASAILVAGSLMLRRLRHVLGFAERTARDDLVRAGLVVVVAVACFWAATVYARELGTREAENVDGDPVALAEVDVYSPKPLDMPGDLVSGSDVNITASALSYRYVGLRLLEFSNNRWLVISGRREGLHCSVLIIKDTDDIRVQIAAPIA